MKQKKWIRTAVAAAAALTLAVSLTACGSNGGNGGASASDNDNGGAEQTSTGRTVEQIQDSGKIVIGVFSDKAPFGYVDSNGDYQGYDVYFGNRIAEDLGVDVEYVPVDPASRVEYVATGKVDIILANFTVTEERAQQVDFALPYMKVALGVVSPDGAEITDVSQLDGKTLIVCKGTTAETYFEENYPNVTLQKYDQYADAYNALLDGRGDAFSTDNTEVLAWALIAIASVYYINAVMEPEDAVKGQAYYTMTYTLASVLGSLIGGPMIDAFGIGPTLAFGTVCAAVGTAIVLRFAQETVDKGI